MCERQSQTWRWLSDSYREELQSKFEKDIDVLENLELCELNRIETIYTYGEIGFLDPRDEAGLESADLQYYRKLKISKEQGRAKSQPSTSLYHEAQTPV